MPIRFVTGGGGSTPTADALITAEQAVASGAAIAYGREGLTHNDDLDTADIALTDSLSVGPDIEVVVVADGNFKASGGGPAGDLSSQGVVVTNDRGPANYMVASSALPWAPEGLFLLFQVQSYVAWAELVALCGTSGTPAPAGNKFAIFVDLNNVGFNISGGGGLAPIAHNGSNRWHSLSMRRSGGTTYLYLCEVDQPWSTMATANNGSSWTSFAGFRGFYQSYATGATVDGWNIAHCALFEDPPSVAEFQAMHEATTLIVPT